MRVLNFGSLNIDYVYSVDHFVKKGETIASSKLNVFSGGKGLNQSIALSRGGIKVCHAGMIGTDGIFLTDMLEEAGVDTRFVIRSDQVRTGNAIIQNDSQGDNCIILYGGANKAVSREMADRVLKAFEPGDWLILQNEISEIPYIVSKAHERGLKIVLNPSPINEEIFQIDLSYVNCFILNEVEAAALAGDGDEPCILLKHLQEKFPRAEIVLTLGEKGAVYGGRDGIIRQEAYKVNTVDTTAAGDTFTGYYLAGRFEGLSVKDSLDIAAKASAIAVSRKGAAPSIPKKAEVEEFFPTCPRWHYD